MYNLKNIFFVYWITDISEDAASLIGSLNSNLPDCIRVFALKKVTGGFNSKIACDSRSYVSIKKSCSIE